MLANDNCYIERANFSTDELKYHITPQSLLLEIQIAPEHKTRISGRATFGDTSSLQLETPVAPERLYQNIVPTVPSNGYACPSCYERGAYG